MSDGLIGDASIFTTISWALGFGTSTSTKLSVSSPSDEMWVNNCFDLFMLAVILFYRPVRLRFEYLGVVSLRENWF
jgi:hypothetical protein